MRRAFLLLIAASLGTMAVLAVAVPASAQAAPERVPALTLPAQLADDSEPSRARAPSSLSFLGSPTGRTLTGAVIGGWLGYFASQVVASDWSDDSAVRASRGGWALGGVVLGGFTGFLTSRRGGAPRAVAPPGAVAGPPEMRTGTAAARSIIEREEIVRSGATNAFEVVRSLRKEWLIPRGVNSFTESARGFASREAGLTVVPGADHILVYLNNSRLGGTQHLEEVSVQMIDRIEFVPGPQATFRWGTGHAHGVILLTTVAAEH